LRKRKYNNDRKKEDKRMRGCEVEKERKYPQILVVDDEPDLLDINSTILRSAGYEVLEASTGNDCLRIATEEHPDLILLDVNLPDISGIDVCRQIKADPELIGTYVILISGMKASSENQVEGLEEGADGYIVRPISKRELLARVHAMMRIKDSETALRESKEELERQLGQNRLILGSIGEGIYGMDMNGDTIFVNAALLKITGYEAEELIGKNLHNILQHSRPDGSPYRVEDCPISATLKDGLTRNATNEVIWRKDSASFPVEYTSAPIREGDKTTGVVVVLRDITRRKQTEEALLKAKEAAEVANRTKTEFIANMSHEIRTPLNAIIGFSEVLQDELFGKLNEKQHEHVKEIIDSGKRLLALILDILDFSEAESGSIKLKISIFRLKDILNSSVTVLKEDAMKRNINLSLKIEPDADIEIEADPWKLRQIMFNLLGNAVKFTQDGGSVSVQARLVNSEQYLKAVNSEQDTVNSNKEKKELFTKYYSLTTGKTDDYSLTTDRNFYEISVEDTGIGIKTEDMDKLFGEFSQIESPYTKKYKGTGLGLALTKKLVELHGGRIWVESEFGKGIKITFVIPIRQ
jgi:PAS domain S-box-containing protein